MEPMNLSETLTYTDISQLHRLARQLNCECNIHSKNELIQSLFHHLTNKYQIHQEFLELSSGDKMFLFNLMFEKRREYTKDAIYAKARQAWMKNDATGSYRGMLEQALEKGWLFRVKMGQEEKFILPDEVRKQWRSLLFDGFQGIRKEEIEGGTMYDGTHHMAQDLESLFRYLENNHVPFAKNGAMYRKHLMNLVHLFHVTEELPAENWRFGYGRRFREYPDRFALIYDFAYHKEWIKEDSIIGNVILTQQGHQFIEEGIKYEQLTKDLFSFWLLSYRRAIPNIENLTRSISFLCKNTWVQEKVLVEQLLPFTSGFYYDLPEDVLNKRVITMLNYFGFLLKTTLCDATNAFTLCPGGETWF